MGFFDKTNYGMIVNTFKQAEADLGMFGRTGAPTRAHWPKITTLLRNIQ